MSKYLLDNQTYNQEIVPVTWETCTLRKWLNTNFYNDAFISLEKSKIQTAIVEDFYYDRNYHKVNTKDRIFLLSYDEMRKYFDSDEKRKALTGVIVLDKSLMMGMLSL